MWVLLYICIADAFREVYHYRTDFLNHILRLFSEEYNRSIAWHIVSTQGPIYMQALGVVRLVNPVSLKLHCSFPSRGGGVRSSRSMIGPTTVKPSLLFRQLFEKESSTYTYLLADMAHPDRPAVVIFMYSMNCSFANVAIALSFAFNLTRTRSLVQLCCVRLCF